MIANRFKNSGLKTETEINYDTATARPTDATKAKDAVGKVRRVDVEAQISGSRPELDTVVLTESKVGYTTNGKRETIEAVNDATILQNNRSIRNAGSLVEGFGKVARPVGVAIDAYSLKSAYEADGNTIGENTGRTAAGITGSVAGGTAGAVGGAKLGASAGTLVAPGVGTVVGGALGGVAGGIAGSSLGQKFFSLFD